jgi:hypothetical protein
MLTGKEHGADHNWRIKLSLFAGTRHRHSARTDYDPQLVQVTPFDFDLEGLWLPRLAHQSDDHSGGRLM